MDYIIAKMVRTGGKCHGTDRNLANSPENALYWPKHHWTGWNSVYTSRKTIEPTKNVTELATGILNRPENQQIKLYWSKRIATCHWRWVGLEDWVDPRGNGLDPTWPELVSGWMSDPIETRSSWAESNLGWNFRTRPKLMIMTGLILWNTAQTKR